MREKPAAATLFLIKKTKTKIWNIASTVAYHGHTLASQAKDGK
jgi:hypothetical protein